MKKALLGIALLALLIPLSGADFGFNDGGKILIKASRTISGGVGTWDTDTTPAGVLVTTYVDGAGSPGCYLSYSSDDGATWTERSLGGTGLACSMTIVTETNWYVVNGPSLLETTNGGTSFGTVSTITDACAGTSSRHHIVDYDSADSDDIMVVFGGGTSSGDDICFAFSNDGGATWATSGIISTSNGDKRPVLVHITGQVWVAAYGGEYFRTTDDGTGWTATAWPGFNSFDNSGYVSRRAVEDAGCDPCLVRYGQNSGNTLAYLETSTDDGLNFAENNIFTQVPSGDDGFGQEAGFFFSGPDGTRYFGGTGATEKPRLWNVDTDDQIIESSIVNVRDANFGFLDSGEPFMVAKVDVGADDDIYYYPGADALQPETVAGLSGQNMGTIDKVKLRWPLSASDPDQDVGDYDYFVVANGGASTTQDTDGNDGGGFREFIVTLGGEGDVVFQVYAEDPITGLVSEDSCAITIDLGQPNDSDSCGTGVGIGGGGAVADTFLGTDLQSAADEVGMNVEGLRWFIGLMLILCIATPLFLAFGGIGGGLGALVGIALSIGFGLIPIWFVVLIVIVSLAAIAFLRR